LIGAVVTENVVDGSDGVGEVVSGPAIHGFQSFPGVRVVEGENPFREGIRNSGERNPRSRGRNRGNGRPKARLEQPASAEAAFNASRGKGDELKIFFPSATTRDPIFHGPGFRSPF
jgi:hypothetical protein